MAILLMSEAQLWQDALIDTNLKAETAVIGSGPGGSMVAACITAAGHNTVVIEEGTYLPQDQKIPFGTEEMRRQYRDHGMTVTLGDNISYVEGSCVGGGSEVNSGLYHRPPAATMDDWATRANLPALGNGALDDYSTAIERNLNVNADAPLDSASSNLAAAANALDLPARQVPRWLSVTAGRPERQSMTRTYLYDHVKAAGKVMSGRKVIGLHKQGNNWLLDCQASGKPNVQVTAPNVFICAGAIQTPALLRRARVSSQAGKQIRMHVMARLVAEFPEALSKDPTSIGACQVSCSQPSCTFGCAASGPAHLASMLAGNAQALQALLEQPAKFASYHVTTDCGRGSLDRWFPATVRYKLQLGDWEILAHGLRLLATGLLEAGALRIWPVVRGCQALTSKADITAQLQAHALVGKAKLAAVHLMASCPMGTKNTPLGPFGEVIGAPGLRVADASVFCGPLGVNPQGTVLALAQRNAVAFLNNYD